VEDVTCVITVKYAFPVMGRVKFVKRVCQVDRRV